MKGKSFVDKVFFDGRFYYCLLVLVFVFFVLISALVTGKKSALLSAPAINYERDWVFSDGSAVDFESLMSNPHAVIYKKVNPAEISNKSLCFFTKNVYFTVRMDDVIIYDFHPKAPAIFGKAYGEFPHTINLPSVERDGILSIELDNIYEKTEGYIETVNLSNGTYFIVAEMQKAIPTMALCLLGFAFGIVFFIIGITGKGFADTRYEIMSLGAFSVVSSLWIASEGSFMSLLFALPVAIHFIDYMMLAMLPIPSVLFATYVTRNKETKVGLVVGLLAAVNILANIILTTTGIKDYHELLIYSHILIGLTVIIVIYLFIRSIVKKRIQKGLIIILAITFSTPIFAGLFEMVRYRINPAEYTGMPVYRYMIFFFIFLCGIYEFVNMSNMSKKSKYAEIMEKMAYTDALTGLYNREAYNKTIDSAQDEKTNYTMVMLDMNHLKMVNDKLGHIMGDEYIRKLAECIQTSFKDAKSFRMGGDEFLIMSSRSASDSVFQEELATLNRKIEEYNKEKNQKIPLSVAAGYAEYSPAMDNLEEAIRLADKNMYNQKKTMKMELGIQEDR